MPTRQPQSAHIAPRSHQRHRETGSRQNWQR
jgi:hypothetical protein